MLFDIHKMANRRTLILFCAELLLSVGVFAAGDWSYEGENGQKHWSDHYSTCEGNKQSPIDIDTEYTLPNQQLQRLAFKNYNVAITGKFKNNGHTVVLSLDPAVNAILRGGGLEHPYQALQLHFHWTKKEDDGGSEHTVDGKQYAAEMHIVHMKSGFQALDDVKDQGDGLAVLGIFMDVGDEDNQEYSPLFDAMGNITHPDSIVEVDGGPTLLNLLPLSEDYYRYMGSLTTPPCYQTVAWTVFKQPVKISQKQLEILQNVLMSASGEEAEEMGGNFRDTQMLGDRIVSEYVDSDIVDLKAFGQSSSWHYHGDHGSSSWPSDFDQCGKRTQSPIDITVNKTAQLKLPDDKGLQLDNYDEGVQGSFINNGHAVQLNFDEDENNFVMSGGGLNGTYSAKQLHFHWGNLYGNGTMHGGSEHTVDGKRYIAEMHIVHLKQNNDDATASDAAAVLGVFFEVNDDVSNDMDEDEVNAVDQLISYIQDTQYTDSTTVVKDGPKLMDLLPLSSGFYRYQGSLTTPPCSQIVVWTIFTKPMQITRKQFIAFQRTFAVRKANTAQAMSLEHRQMYDEEHDEEGDDEGNRKRRSLEGNATIANVGAATIRDNYRPVQELYGRTVYIYDDAVIEADSIPWLQIVLYTLAGIAAFIVFAIIAIKCCAKNTRKYDNKEYQAGRSAEMEML